MLFICSNLEKTDNKQRKKKKKFLKPEPELEPINLFPGADIKIYPQHYSTDLSLRSSSWKSVVSSCSPSSRSFSSHSRRFSSHSSLQVITFMFWILREIRKRWKAREKKFQYDIWCALLTSPFDYFSGFLLGMVVIQPFSLFLRPLFVQYVNLCAHLKTQRFIAWMS